MTGFRKMIGSTLLRPVLAIGMAMFIGVFIIMLSNQDPLFAYSKMVMGAFGGFSRLAESLDRSIPIILTGLATAVAFRTGVFNAGVEGSLYLGAFAAFLVGHYVSVSSSIIHVPLVLGAAALAGAVWAFIPGYTKAVYKVDETVTTILLNYVAILFTAYLVAIPFKDVTAGSQQTPLILETAHLYRFLPPSRVHIGLFLAILLAILLYWFFKRTTWGYNFNMTGMNPHYAHYVGINVERTMIYSMLISGAIGGIAGACQIMGILYRFIDQFSPGYGFEGIAVSLLARNNPLGILVAGFFYGALQTGATYMDRTTDVPKELITSLVAIIIFFVTAEGLFTFVQQNGAFRKKLHSIPILGNLVHKEGE